MNNEVRGIITGLVAENLYMQNLGVEFLDIEEGYISARIPVREGIINPYGSVHGGALYSVADIVAGFCACTYGRYVSTSTGNMVYIAPAMNTEYIHCEARVLHRGNKVASVAVELRADDAKLLDTATFTFCLLSKEVI